MKTTAWMMLTLVLSAGSARADFNHDVWSALLRAHVHAGEVDYAAIKKSGKLRTYREQLEAVTPAQLGELSREQRLAFWLNVYNAYTVQLIVDHYPLDTIRDIGLLPYAAFRKEFIELPAAGQDDEISLDFIEHKIVRKQFNEPRVHFALVCAARSCPPLRSEAYRAATLDAQLDDQARAFLNDESKNRWDRKTGTLYLSKILDWFAGDFTKTGKTVPAYVAQFIDGLDAAAVERVEHMDYDWALNGK